MVGHRKPTRVYVERVIRFFAAEIVKILSLVNTGDFSDHIFCMNTMYDIVEDESSKAEEEDAKERHVTMR